MNREWRERNNSPNGRYGPPPGKPTNLYQLQNTPSWLIRASENWVISDRLLHRFAFGYNRFGNDESQRLLQCRVAVAHRADNQPDTTFPRFNFNSGAAILGNWGGTGIFGSMSRGNSNEGSVVVQDDLTFVTGKHSIKTGFEGRFYYVDNDSADGTASYNFNSAQTNLPGFDQQTGYSYASFLLGAVQTSSRPVQAVNPDYYQRDYSFYVQDDFKVSPKLTLNLGLRWTIVPGFYEKNGYVTNLDLSLPNPAAGNRPGALRFADQEGREDVHRHVLRRSATTCRRGLRGLGQDGDQRRIQREPPRGDGLQRRRGFRRSQFDRLQRDHLRHARHPADAERSGPGDVPQRGLSELRGDAAELRPVAAEQPGLRPAHHRQRGQAREVPQLQRDACGVNSPPTSR